MVTTRKLPYLDDLISWLGIGWIVAFLAGLWGALLGIGKFGLSEFLFLFSGAIIVGKVGFETIRDRTKSRVFALTIVFFAIVCLEFCVMRWTNGLAVESATQQERLRKLDDIPGLDAQLQALKQQEAIDRAKAEQQVSDIGHDNRDLKESIEKKDTLLASIAKQQYELNFAPQVAAVNVGVPDQIQIVNNGKSVVNLIEIRQNGQIQTAVHLPESIIQGGEVGLRLTESTKQQVPLAASKDAITNDYRTSIEYSVLLETGNNKRYLLPFTWTFIVKDGAIVSSFATDLPIMQQANQIQR